MAAVAGGLFAGKPALAAMPEVRLGTLQFGTVQWLANVIARHRFDARHGIALKQVKLANIGAGRIALMAGAADVIVSDWLFVAVQRAAGTRLCFAPLSTTTGGVMVRAGSPIRDLKDLEGQRLGVAGGPTDKSWLIVRAAAKAETGRDLQQTADVVYAAPPLLNAKLLQGELDAALTFWNFAARLDAAGCREAVSVAACAHRLGLPAALALVGFSFHEDWARAHRHAINGLLAAAADAETLLVRSDAEWDALRPIMKAKSDVLFQDFKRRFRAGMVRVSAKQEQKAAAQVFDVLLRTGGPAATGGLKALPAGIFWPKPYG